MNLETFKPGRYRATVVFTLIFNKSGCEDIEFGDELNIYPPDNFGEMRVDWFQDPENFPDGCTTDSIHVSEFTHLPDNCLELVREVDFMSQTENDLKTLKDSFATKEFQQKIRNRIAKFKATYLDWIDKALDLIEYGEGAGFAIKDDHYTLMRCCTTSTDFTLDFWNCGKGEKIAFSKTRLPEVLKRAEELGDSHEYTYMELKQIHAEISKWQSIFVHLQSAISGIRKYFDEINERELEEAKEISRFFS